MKMSGYSLAEVLVALVITSLVTESFFQLSRVHLRTLAMKQQVDRDVRDRMHLKRDFVNLWHLRDPFEPVQARSNELSFTYRPEERPAGENPTRLLFPFNSGTEGSRTARITSYPWGTEMILQTRDRSEAFRRTVYTNTRASFLAKPTLYPDVDGVEPPMGRPEWIWVTLESVRNTNRMRFALED